jgi:hypothetical protein
MAVQISTRLMAGARDGGSEPSEFDPIDALGLGRTRCVSPTCLWSDSTLWRVLSKNNQRVGGNNPAPLLGCLRPLEWYGPDAGAVGRTHPALLDARR